MKKFFYAFAVVAFLASSVAPVMAQDKEPQKKECCKKAEKKCCAEKKTTSCCSKDKKETEKK